MNAPHPKPAPTARSVAPLPPLPPGHAGLSMAEAFLAALAALAANKLRAALTALGIFIGVAAVIVTVAVGAGARQQVLAQIQSLGANLLVVWGANLRLGGVSLGAGQRPNLSWDDAQEIPRQIAAVQVAAGTSRQQQQVVAGNQNWSTTIVATDPDYFIAHDWVISEGRFFTQEESLSGRKLVLLGATVAENLFGDEDPVGREIRIRATPFEVLGVLGRKGQNPMGQDQDDVVIMPFWTARRSVMGASRAFARSVGTISVKVHEGESMSDVEEELRQFFRQRHRVAANEPDTVSIRNLSEIAATRDASARTLSLLLAAVAAVSLLVGGIGVMNIMLVSVTERTREIGLRLAIGAREREVLLQFLIEAVVLAAIGGLIGMTLALGASIGLAALMSVPFVFDPAINALAFAFSAAIGVLFGYFPARRAARLNPIEALRHE